MSEEFMFNARQYYDFTNSKDDDENEAYFGPIDETIVNNYCSDSEEEIQFYTPHRDEPTLISEEDLGTQAGPNLAPPEQDISLESPSRIFLKTKIRRSQSASQLHVEIDPVQTNTSDGNRNKPVKVTKKFGSTSNLTKVAPISTLTAEHRSFSKESLNRLAQPKLNGSNGYVSMAEAVSRFERGTPQRFRSKPDKVMIKPPLLNLNPKTPKLTTQTRNRPVYALSKEEKEKRELEEVKRAQFKAHLVNKKVLTAPFKIKIEKRPATAVEPFKLTEPINKVVASNEPKFKFHAKPVPKAAYDPVKLPTFNRIMPTVPVTPQCMKRQPQPSPKAKKIADSPRPFKPTKTEPIPFSFEQRTGEYGRKREELINKVLEEERKARQFHANPPPRYLANKTGSFSSGSSSPSKNAHNQKVEPVPFKARPAIVLKTKPFEPIKTNHVIEIDEFQFATEERLEKRHEFDQKIKTKEESYELLKQTEELNRLQKEDEERNRLRKETKFKAQEIKKYRPLEIKKANKVTMPKSPVFETDRLRNKENIQAN